MFLLHTCLQPALLLGQGCQGDWELLADSDWEAAGAEGAAGSALSTGERRQGRSRVMAPGVPACPEGGGGVARWVPAVLSCLLHPEGFWSRRMLRAGRADGVAQEDGRKQGCDKHTGEPNQ